MGPHGLPANLPQSLGITQGMLDYGFQSVVFFMLIFSRLVGIFVQAPMFGRLKGIPMPVQIGYSLVISFVLYHMLPIPKDLPEGIFPFFLTVIGQVLVGLMIGFASYMVAAGAQFGGELIDMQLSMTMAATLDPSSGGNVSLIRTFEFRLAILVWIFIHGDYFFFRAVARSYELIPATHYAFTGPATAKLVEMTAGLFVMGLEIAAPVIAAVLIVSLALGLLNRAAQQFNVFMISFATYILVGLGVLILSLGPFLARALPSLYSHLNHDMMVLIMSLVGK